MASDRNRLLLQPECRSWPATPYRDIQMHIGQAMRWQYEVPKDLPDELLTLLKQLNETEAND
jgi:hypothetical protein